MESGSMPIEQMAQWSLDVVCCALRQALNLYCLSQPS